MLESLNRYFAAWLATLRAVISPAAFGPFLVLALLQGLALWFLLRSPSPIFGGWPTELLRSWFGAGVGHYPAHFAVLPVMFFRIAVVMYGLVGIVAYGAATGAFARRFSGEWTGPRGLLGTAVSRYLPLFIIWLATTAVVLFGIAQVPGLFKSWAYGSPRREILIDLVTRMVVIAFMSFWAYTTVVLIVQRATLLGAVAASVRQCLRRPLATFFLLGVPYLLTLPFSLLAAQTERVIGKFRPETVAIVLLLVIISQFAANLLTCGSVTHYFLAEPARK